jgi:hypothetical protein
MYSQKEVKKQMDKSYVLALLSIAMIGIFGVSYAWMGPMNVSNLTNEEILALQETRAQIQDAIANGDYGTWKALMTQQFEKMTTEEKFNEMVQNYQIMSQYKEQIQEAMQNGDYKLAN